MAPRMSNGSRLSSAGDTGVCSDCGGIAAVAVGAWIVWIKTVMSAATGPAVSARTRQLSNAPNEENNI